ncbi:MAG: hypothetical protein ACTIJ1_01120, partial [Mesonia sp.]|uniref:hypothetical protein n=1 Tax=Mesonia sp. TaxID=1960830 RepID=UPI003F98A69E
SKSNVLGRAGSIPASSTNPTEMLGFLFSILRVSIGMGFSRRFGTASSNLNLLKSPIYKHL